MCICNEIKKNPETIIHMNCYQGINAFSQCESWYDYVRSKSYKSNELHELINEFRTKISKLK